MPLLQWVPEVESGQVQREVQGGGSEDASLADGAIPRGFLAFPRVSRSPQENGDSRPMDGDQHYVAEFRSRKGTPRTLMR